MTNNNNNLIPKENYKKVEEVREIKNEVPSFEEFMKTYEIDKAVNYDDLTYSDISDKGKGYGPVIYYRDVAHFFADASSNMDHWTYRALFQYPDGTIEKKLSLTGINEMKETLKKIENGTIKVVRTVGYDSLKYEPSEFREKELKEALRKEIEKLENNYSHVPENITLMSHNAFKNTIQF